MIFAISIILYVLSGDVLKYQIPALLVWGLFAAEMITKLFPSKIESMGSQKQFKANFLAAKENVHVKIEHQKRVILIAVMWLVLNGVIAHFYFKHIIDEGIMIIISLFYSVCDMICVLFFCPFQRIMANKCCTTCRIHNWDYVMMFTPMVFVNNVFAISLLCLVLSFLSNGNTMYTSIPKDFVKKQTKILPVQTARKPGVAEKA